MDREGLSMGDLISRQAAVDVINYELKYGAVVDQCGLKTAYDLIEALPSAQPERKKGKWVRYDGDWLKTMCKCSECGAMVGINEKYRNLFCYHCGARMDGEQV